MIEINTVDGKLFSGMVISGANNLYNHKNEVDELNVFPVPDGDTGTNMSLTVNAVAAELLKTDEASLTKVADLVSFATLRGARGNSGVILSQLFRGISKALKGKNTCNVTEFSKALAEGAAAAYKAVMTPTEGTILTVAREAAEGAVQGALTEDDLLSVMEMCVEKGREALEKTPELLPTLKEAGVVDAGGQGWFYILEGMREFVATGVCIKSEAPAQEVAVKKTAQASIKTEDIKFKYCTEFIIEKSDRKKDTENFRETIRKIGDSMLVIDDDDVVKVHIHTNHPGIVIEKAGELGELINIKIDNMKHQHKSIIKKSPTPSQREASSKPEVVVKSAEITKEYGFVAVCTGKGIVSILEDLNVDHIIEGGQTMNPSTEDFLKAINKIPAKTVFLFPNNKNIILAANQAKELSGKDVIVIPTRSIPQCISALVAFSENKTPELNEKAMNKAAKNVKTGQVTFAVRDTSIDNKPIKKGDILGICDGKINAVGENPEAVCEEIVELMADEDSEFITVYYGKGLKKQAVANIQDRLENLYPDCEVLVKKGGQPLYYYIVSVE